ncbi:MAG TPA: allantoate amidohydrolase [Verrucomicrobiae bacterium]|nr:allantoate amidohydrolase [Verrucomicrobiae bacterium]
MQLIEEVERVVHRLESLGKITEESGRLTRTFGSPAMCQANELAGLWMKQAGMTVRQDAIGNLIGHYSCARPGARKLLLGSHLDTVRNAGKFDGALGVLLAIACVEQLRRPVPFNIEVIAFADEEGVRFQSSYLGSRAVTGNFDSKDLDRTDADGITMAEGIRSFGGDPLAVSSCRIDAKELIGYVEAHIEQGPVLEHHHHAIGIVSAIAGQTRVQVELQGTAGHAGTVPMALRKDALCAAAEFTLAVEKQAREIPELVATVGELAVERGASNVIPGFVRLSLDVRHQDDATREAACESLRQSLGDVARRRQIESSWQIIQKTSSAPCSAELSALLREAATKHQPQLMTLPSGAGHDAAVMAKITPVAMLFLRCKNGLSHHPDEWAAPEDIAVALATLSDFISLLAARHE